MSSMSTAFRITFCQTEEPNSHWESGEHSVSVWEWISVSHEVTTCSVMAKHLAITCVLIVAKSNKCRSEFSLGPSMPSILSPTCWQALPLFSVSLITLSLIYSLCLCESLTVIYHRLNNLFKSFYTKHYTHNFGSYSFTDVEPDNK